MMRRLALSFAAAVLVTAGTAAPAAACINEPRTKHEEREFRSQYDETLERDEKPANEGILPIVRAVVVGAVGASLIGGSAWVATRP